MEAILIEVVLSDCLKTSEMKTLQTARNEKSWKSHMITTPKYNELSHCTLRQVLILCLILIKVNISNGQSTFEKVEKLANKCSNGSVNSCLKLAQIATNDTDPRVCMAALNRIDDQAILCSIAKNATHGLIILAAIEKITDQNILVELAKNATDSYVRESAIKKVEDQNALGDIAINDIYGVARDACEKIIDPKILNKVAKYSKESSVRIMAVNKINDQYYLIDIAKNDEFLDAAERAMAKIIDQRVLLDIAKNGKSSSIRKAAVRSITSQKDLFDIVKYDQDIENRKTAVEKIKDQNILLYIAKNDIETGIRKVAFDKIERKDLIIPILNDHISDSILKSRLVKNPSISIESEGIDISIDPDIPKNKLVTDEDREFNGAKRIDYYETYVKFLKKYPNSIYSEKVKDRLTWLMHQKADVNIIWPSDSLYNGPSPYSNVIPPFWPFSFTCREKGGKIGYYVFSGNRFKTDSLGREWEVSGSSLEWWVNKPDVIIEPSGEEIVKSWTAGKEFCNGSYFKEYIIVDKAGNIFKHKLKMYLKCVTVSTQKTSELKNEYRGHIAEFLVYPSTMNMNCGAGSCQFYLKEFENTIFFISKTDAIKYGLIKETKPSKTVEDKIANYMIMSPEDNNKFTVISIGKQVKLTTNQCDDYNNMKYVVVVSCAKIVAPPKSK